MRAIAVENEVVDASRVLDRNVDDLLVGLERNLCRFECDGVLLGINDRSSQRYFEFRSRLGEIERPHDPGQFVIEVPVRRQSPNCFEAMRKHRQDQTRPIHHP